MEKHSQNRIAVDLARQLLERGGELPITVDSVSMSPCARIGDTYMFVAMDIDLEVGDIVLAEGRKKPITHRIIRISKDRLLLKGDVRPDCDGYFAGSEVIAVCRSISNDSEIRSICEGKEKRLGKTTAFLSLWHGRIYRITGSSHNTISKIVFLPFHYWHWLTLNLIYRRH